MAPASVLFDLDNTLTARRASVERFALAFIADYAARLRDVEPSRIQQLFVASDQNGYNPARPQELHDTLPWKSTELAASPSELDEYWQSRQAYSTLLRPGALALLEELRSAGWRLGVVTNGAVRGQQAKLDHLDLTAAVDAIVISEAAGCKKPDPRIFTLALQQLGTEAAETWFVGDHPVNDVVGAAACGMRAVWVEADQRWPNAEPQPSFVVREIAELRALLLESTPLPEG